MDTTSSSPSPRCRYGWNDTGSIEDWIALNAPRLDEEVGFVITSLDSHLDVATLKSTKGRFGQPLGPGSGEEQPLMVDGAEIVDMTLQHHLFNGFDEVWIVSEGFKPESWHGRPGSLVGPKRLDQLTDSLGDAMRGSGVIAGLGDGTGLNFVYDEDALPRPFEFPE